MKRIKKSLVSLSERIGYCKQQFYHAKRNDLNIDGKEVRKINEVYHSIHTLYNKMDRQMKTVKEAIEEKDLERTHRNLINLADNNEELMQEIRWIKKGTVI